MSNMITITGADYTIESFRADWADDVTLTPAQIEAAADAQYAWLVLETRDRMRGWSYTGNGFTGLARADAVAVIIELMTDSVDHVVRQLDEIKAEVQ